MAACHVELAIGHSSRMTPSRRAHRLDFFPRVGHRVEALYRVEHMAERPTSEAWKSSRRPKPERTIDQLNKLDQGFRSRRERIARKQAQVLARKRALEDVSTAPQQQQQEEELESQAGTRQSE